MNCERCGRDLEDDWHYCPKCGAKKGGDPMDNMGRDIFSKMLLDFKKNFKDMDNFDEAFSKDIQALDLSPYFQNIHKRQENSTNPVKRKGFSIKITTRKGMGPKVDIQNLDTNRQEIQPRKIEPAKPEGEKARSIFKTVPKQMKEPATEVKNMGNRVTVDIDMPGVRSVEDTEVKQLESSVEVKAVAGDMAYFKILTKPVQYKLRNKNFIDGKLHLEFS